MTTFLDWHLTPQRVAIHVPTATAVVADLHLGYHEARRHSGDAVPLVDLQTTLAPLMLVLERHDAKNLVIAGDLFEKVFDLNLWHDFKAWLTKTGVHFLGLVPGNHDRGMAGAPPDLPLLAEGLALGAWHILHGDGRLPKTPAVLGHFHPCVPWRGRKIPCYLAGPSRLVLPAFSRDASGGNVRPLARWRGYRCLTIVSGKVLDLGIVAGRKSLRRTRLEKSPPLWHNGRYESIQY